MNRSGKLPTPHNVFNLKDYSSEDKGKREARTSHHREAFELSCIYLEHLPYPIKATESLLFASRLIENAGYTLARESQSRDVTGLFLVAAELERKVTKIIGE